MFRLPAAWAKSTVRSFSIYGKVDERIVSLITGIVGPENITTSESGNVFHDLNYFNLGGMVMNSE